MTFPIFLAESRRIINTKSEIDGKNLSLSKIVSAAVKGSLSTQPKKGSQKSKKPLPIDQKWRKWWKLRSLCLQQEIVDTQGSVLTTLPTGFPRYTRNLYRLKCVNVERRFQTKVPPKNLFLCKKNLSLKNLLKTLLSKSENFCTKSGKIEDTKTFVKSFLEFILQIVWVQFWRLGWKLPGKILEASLQFLKMIWIKNFSNFYWLRLFFRTLRRKVWQSCQKFPA